MFPEEFKLALSDQTGIPFYEQLCEQFRTGIRSGRLGPRTPFPPERELIETLGIARTTLRKALVQLEKEGLVCRRHGVGTFVADQARWRPVRSVLNLGIVTYGTRLTGYQKDVVGHLCAEALSLGMQVHTLRPAEDRDPLHIESWSQELQLQGLISMPARTRRDLEELGRVHIPKVILELREQQAGLDNVVIDSFHGVYSGVSELIRLGHRDIAFVGGLLLDHDHAPDGGKHYKLAQDSLDRGHAYRRALEDAMLPFRAERCFELPYDQVVVTEWLSKQKHSEALPTACVVFSDSLAMMVASACRAHGLRVPEDVSIMGFGNSIPESRRGELATAQYDYQELARLAVQRILERATRGGISGVTMSVKSHFKNGMSLAPAPRKAMAGAGAVGWLQPNGPA